MVSFSFKADLTIHTKREKKGSNKDKANYSIAILPDGFSRGMGLFKLQ
jgi:hypothetical protein